MLSLILSALLASATTTTTTTPTLDLNRASLGELAALPGVGPVLAARIVEKRPYKRPSELLRVRGIGAKRFLKLRDRLLVDPPRASKVVSRSARPGCQHVCPLLSSHVRYDSGSSVCPFTCFNWL